MCGIAGFVDFKKISGEDVLKEMVHCVRHRGPDGEGTWFNSTNDANIGLGHRRLSIIDLSAGANQPMHYNGMHVVFNGEIYNYHELREELISLGHQFLTHSDTEVILHGWREWGQRCIDKWHGMFSVVIYDEKTKELICIRDRAGVKPLHYYWKDGLFLFGSELKIMMKHPRFERNVNHNAVASFLQYNYVPQPHSIFDNVFKLPAGHLLRFDIEGKTISVKQYWNVYDYYNKPKLKIDFAEAVGETERILEEAFQLRMVADVPVGVFLSGGIDSSCVTALLQKNTTEKIKTFTIGMTDKTLDEAPFAKQIANYLGTDHTEYYCTSKEALDIISELPFYYDEPFADPSAIPTILVSRLAKSKVTVALSADAGDEVFAGYNRYDYISRYGQKIASIPKPLRKLSAIAMAKISSDSIPYLRNQRHFHSRYDKLRNLLNDPDSSELLKNLTQVFTEKEISGLFNQKVTILPSLHSSGELKGEFYDPLSYMMAVDYQTYMVDDILQKVDRATMSISLEGREPFLDQNIIEWAAQLPSQYKYFKGQKKYILKEILFKYIPRRMMERPKMGFAIPVEKWLSDELRPLVQEYLCTPMMNRHGLFKATEVERLCADFYNGHKEKYLKIWHLLMFQMWYQKWIV